MYIDKEGKKAKGKEGRYFLDTQAYRELFDIAVLGAEGKTDRQEIVEEMERKVQAVLDRFMERNKDANRQIAYDLCISYLIGFESG